MRQKLCEPVQISSSQRLIGNNRKSCPGNKFIAKRMQIEQGFRNKLRFAQNLGSNFGIAPPRREDERSLG